MTAWAGQDRGIRLVNFVEMTCPVFRLDKLKAFLDCYDGGLVGWGIDWWYCNVLGADFYRKFAIIDGITVTNPHDYQRRGGTREISKLQSNDERLAHWQRVMTQHNLKEYKSETVGYVSTEYSGQSEAKAPENAQASGLTPHPVPPVRWFSPAVDESKVAAAVPVVSEALVSAVSVTLPGNATESDRDPAAHIDDLARTLGELVGERPIALLDWPFYPNAGDHFIWLGEKILFRHRLRSEIIHECSLQKVDFLALSRLPAETVFVMHGGGNFGDLYPHHQRLREAVVAAFPDRRILVMPQTVFFQDPEQLERSARCMILHPDLHVIARDRGSLATLRSRMGLANCYLHIDAAFALQQIVTELVKNVAVAPRHDTVCLLRDDIEAATIAPPVEGVQRFDWMRAEDLAEFAANVPDIGAIPVARDTFRGPFDSYSWQRLCAAVRRLCDGRRIVTDRLHGHILAVMMGKHHEFHDNSYGKNAAFRETWTRGNPLMTFVRGAQRASDTLPAAGLPAHRVPSQRGITASAPVFLLTLHRGGGTLLTRILNCHPDLVIWGEHNGLFNRLAEMDDLATRVSFLMAPKSDAAIADYTAFSDHRLNNFDPWANPFDYDAFRHSCRDMIERIFTRGLRPGQRWGFKEIRYHRVPTVRYLEKLFPDARFIILRRDIQDVAVSGILAGWSLRWLENYRDKMPLAMAESIVRDVTYALLAIECGLDAVQADLGPRCLQLDYSQLADPALGFAARLFEFCGLVLSDPVIERIRKVQRVRAGGSNQAVCFGGVLSRDFIREEVARLAPELRAEIAGDGIDPARLLAQEGLGQYSFLVGDHYMRERGDGASSLFSYTGVRPMRASDPSVPANSEIRTELPPTHRADNLPARSIKSFPSLSPDDEYRRHEAEESTKTSALKRLGIIVPYRNRAPHLAKLLPHMISYFMRRGDTGVGEVTFIVVEQNDDLPFNRGGLLNAGFRAIETMVEYVCFHDVDYLPMWADYSYADMPTRIIWWGMHTRPIRVNNPSRRTQAPRVGLGAVSLFTNERFRAVNGYSNRFFGWGFEDKDLAARCALHSLAIEQRDGTFIPLDHDNAGFQDDGSKSPAWIENERRYAENQKAYRLHGTGQEGLSSLSVHTGAIQYARIAGLDGAESAEVMHLQVSFDDRRTGEAATRKLPGAITVRSSA